MSKKGEEKEHTHTTKSNKRNEEMSQLQLSGLLSYGFDTVKLLVADIELCAMLNWIEEKMNIKLNEMIFFSKKKKYERTTSSPFVESNQYQVLFSILFKSLRKKEKENSDKKMVQNYGNSTLIHKLQCETLKCYQNL